MSRIFPPKVRRYRGSALLLSARQRVLWALCAVGFLWALTGWALQWW
ncbi:hypothetical protein KVP09_06715 [Alcaligenaceae bacterium CGII-47]|nr:hypothetical protein [Alcaligenaceae bacterium CGII-47]